VSDDRNLSFAPRTLVLRLATALLVVNTAWTTASGGESSTTISNGPPVAANERNWYAVSPEKFAALPEARKPIQISALDGDLLAAAILHATNQQRAKHRLPALEYDPAATQAARLQANVMAKEKFLGHENDFDPALKTPLDRIRKVGLKPRFIAENVALEFARQYRSGDLFYTRTVDGETVFSATPDGPPMPMHSYASFAAALLDGWMHSPDHRANILSDKPRRLGCAGATSRDEAGMEVFYCAQVFFTPREEPQAN
jgi:uncharacterized protein YkwD